MEAIVIAIEYDEARAGRAPVVRCRGIDGVCYSVDLGAGQEVLVDPGWQPAVLDVVDLLIEGNRAYIAPTGEVARRWTVRAYGNAAAPEAGLSCPDLPEVRVPGGAVVPDEAAEGVEGGAYRVLQQAANGRVTLLIVGNPANPQVAVFDIDGGADGLAREVISRQQDDVRAQVAAQANASFVNPYTFVPLPETVSRGRPPGHLRLDDDRLSGWFDVRWTARTPVLFRGMSGLPDDLQATIPGSSIKGAVRSLHEALAGGCLRVVDLDFVPTYRDQPQPRHGWRLLRVTAVDAEYRPTEGCWCDDVVWVDHQHVDWTGLTAGRPLTTGDCFDLQGTPGQDGHGRQVLRGGQMAPGNTWTVLVTDARVKAKRDHYHVAAGRMAAAPSSVTVTREAWRSFRNLVDDTDDLRRAHQDRKRNPGAPIDVFAEVALHHDKLLRRRAFVLDGTGRPVAGLQPGDVVWAQTDSSGEVAGLALAVVWRHEGKHPLGERVPPDLKPCGDPSLLCATCMLFGSADTKGGSSGPASQHSYGAHLRFGPGRPDGEITLTPIGLAPMGAPRLGAGQFSLDNHDAPAHATPGAVPIREWGSAADHAGPPRQVRGRKHYWAADPTVQEPPRWKSAPHHPEQMRGAAHLAPSGSKWTSRIWFENLSIAQIGSVLATLDPGAVLEGEVGAALARHAGGEYVVRLGGGKPFGFGAVTTEIADRRIHSASTRYLGGADPQFDPAAAIEAFRAEVPQSVRMSSWPALAAVLHTGHVNSAIVSYPPGRRWSERGENRADFEQRFTFWRRSIGSALADQALVSLPDATAANPALPIQG